MEYEISVHPAQVRDGDRVVIRGRGFRQCPLRLLVNGKPQLPAAIAFGYPMPEGFRPGHDGTFVVEWRVGGLGDGEHTIAVEADQGHDGAKASLRVRDPQFADRQPRKGEDGKTDDGAADESDETPDTARARTRWLERLRVGSPSISAAVQAREIDRLRGGQRVPLGPVKVESHIVPGIGNWTLAGPAPSWDAANHTYAGRTKAVVIDPVMPATIYIAAEGGGVWKSTDSGNRWSPTSDYQSTTRCLALAMDPHDHNHLVAGTGVDGYPGAGLLSSLDGGGTWTEIAAATLGHATIFRVVFDASDLTSTHLFACASTGLYEATDGSTFLSLRAGRARDMVVIADAPTAGTLTAVAAFDGEGVLRATRTAGVWSAWTPIAAPGLPATVGNSFLGQCAALPRTIFAAIAQAAFDGLEGIFRSNDAGVSWSRVDVRFNSHYNAYPMGGSSHTHTLDIPTADMIAPAAARVYTTAAGGSPPHTHTVTLTLNQVRALAGGSTLDVQTDVDATGHRHEYWLYGLSQANGNTHISPHPSNPNVLYYGNVLLYKNAAGGGVFNDVHGDMHVDQHSFAFDPVMPDLVVWAGNDGGVWRSGDGGATWHSKNRGLATLECYTVSSHPIYDAVILTGTQDNGVSRATAAAVWRQVYGWDILATAIDRVNPRRMYIERQNQNGVMRSDSGGEPGSWTDTTPVPGGSPQFGNPVVADPSTADVIYFGNTQVWRSDSAGGAWTPLTATFPANVHAIAPHPTDPLTLYAAAGSHVYRVQKIGATWITTDLGAPIVSGVTLLPSGLAVDGAGTVWMTTSTTIWGIAAVGRVFYRAPADTGWTQRDTGLPGTVPMTCIVVDASAPGRMFAGGDVGVYRTNDGGTTWSVWDQGLPSVQVYALDFGPGGLLRAATYGRSVWERVIAPPLLVPNSDTWLRDNFLDTGRATPSPDNAPDPFDAALRVYHWQSADIKVDAEALATDGSIGAYQTTTPIGDDDVAFESQLEHRNPLRGRTARVYVQVHNRGPADANHVHVRVFFADAHMGLPNVPTDFWTAPLPFGGAPATMDWTPVGPTQTFDVLAAGRAGVKEWDWPVPATANTHSCLLAIISSDEELLDGSGITSADQLVRERKQVALHNLHVVDPAHPMMLMFGGSSAEGGRGELVIRWGTLPRGTRVWLALEKLPRGEVMLEGAKTVAAPPERLPATRPGRCEDDHHFDLARTIELRRGDEDETLAAQVAWKGASSLAVVCALELPKPHAGEARFDLLQRAGRRIVGGNSYVVG